MAPTSSAVRMARRFTAHFSTAALFAASACSHDWDGLVRPGEAPDGGAGATGGGGAAGNGASTGSASSSGPGGAGGSASASGGGGSGGTGGLADGDCPTNAPGPGLVKVTASVGGSYCVDATEVTNSDYATWLATNPATGSQPPQCAFNISFVPSAGWPAPAGSEQVPVKVVDWCDALAYCAGVGKHLCGKIGGGANLPADYAVATKSAWFNACSSGGAKAYPYGGVYSPGACNGIDYGAGAPIDVASAAACVGGTPGMHDMSGNVWEWEDSCNADTGPNDPCRIRGGGYINPSVQLACGADSSAPRNLASGNIGFRCCADVLPAP